MKMKKGITYTSCSLPFIADYAVWALLFAKGQTMNIVANFSVILSLVESNFMGNLATSSFKWTWFG